MPGMRIFEGKREALPALPQMMGMVGHEGVFACVIERRELGQGGGGGGGSGRRSKNREGGGEAWITGLKHEYSRWVSCPTLFK